MSKNLFNTPQYRTLMQEHLSKTISYLFESDQEFALACEVKYITFSPQLPDSIKDNFDHTVLFILVDLPSRVRIFKRNIVFLKQDLEVKILAQLSQCLCLRLDRFL